MMFFGALLFVIVGLAVCTGGVLIGFSIKEREAELNYKQYQNKKESYEVEIANLKAEKVMLQSKVYTLTTRLKIYEDNEQYLKQKLDKTNSDLNRYIDMYQAEKARANIFRNMNKLDSINGLDNETLKIAFKKLMLYSHPDKGNCKDSGDFIKYRKLYEKFK